MKEQYSRKLSRKWYSSIRRLLDSLKITPDKHEVSFKVQQI